MNDLSLSLSVNPLVHANSVHLNYYTQMVDDEGPESSSVPESLLVCPDCCRIVNPGSRLRPWMAVCPVACPLGQVPPGTKRRRGKDLWRFAQGTLGHRSTPAPEPLRCSDNFSDFSDQCDPVAPLYCAVSRTVLTSCMQLSGLLFPVL